MISEMPVYFSKTWSISTLALLLVALLVSTTLSRAADVNLAWDPSTGAAGYRLHYGIEPGNYAWSVRVGASTTYTVTGLQDGIGYCFAATAYNADQTVESDFSNEVCIEGMDQALAPIAQFSASPRTGTVPLDVAFSDTSIGEITSRSWNFGDGTVWNVGAGQDGRNFSYSYAIPGRYTVSLTVAGPGGSKTETKTDYIIASEVSNVDTGSQVDQGTTTDGRWGFLEDFNAYEYGEVPPDWINTMANNSLSEDSGLFEVIDFNGARVFSTASTETNIHSHYSGSALDRLASYEYSGRLGVTDPRGGIGVTFFSQYPHEDAYYRLRRYGEEPSFHIAPHPDGVQLAGDIDTGVVPAAGVPYRFRIRVKDTGTSTQILAKIWAEGQQEPVEWQAEAYDRRIYRLTGGTVGFWSMGPGGKLWDDVAVYDLAAEQLVDTSTGAGTTADGQWGFLENFDAYGYGEVPSDWINTMANNSLVEDSGLFEVIDLNGSKVFSTASTETNIHSHYSGSAFDSLGSYEYSGRLGVTDPLGGIGVTFFSQYPHEDAYYRLRRYSAKPSFQIAPHPDGVALAGDVDTGVVPAAGVPYRFRIRVKDMGTETQILAKVWAEGKQEPVEWQAEANDRRAYRLTGGTIGFWSMGPGGKFWDDVAVSDP